MINKLKTATLLINRIGFAMLACIAFVTANPAQAEATFQAIATQYMAVSRFGS